MVFMGRYADGEAYQHGDVVQHRNTLWHAETDTRARPGESADWRMMLPGLKRSRE